MTNYIDIPAPRVTPVDRIVPAVGVEVQAACVADGVGLEEAATKK